MPVVYCWMVASFGMTAILLLVCSLDYIGRLASGSSGKIGMQTAFLSVEIVAMVVSTSLLIVSVVLFRKLRSWSVTGALVCIVSVVVYTIVAWAIIGLVYVLETGVDSL